MDWQRNDDLAKYAAAIYGLFEQSHDLKNIYIMLRKVGSKTTVRNHKRIAHVTIGSEPAAGAKKARPIRVELSLTQNRDKLMSLLKHLIKSRSAHFAKISISPWL